MYCHTTDRTLKKPKHIAHTMHSFFSSCMVTYTNGTYFNNGRCTSWNFSKTWAKPLNPQALENNIIYTASIINILLWEKFIEIKMTWTVHHFAEDDTGCCRGCERVDGNWFFLNNYPQHLLHNSFSLSLLIFCMVKRNVYIYKQNATAKKPWCIHTQTKCHSKEALMCTYTNKMPQQESHSTWISLWRIWQNNKGRTWLKPKTTIPSRGIVRNAVQIHWLPSLHTKKKKKLVFGDKSV